MKLCYYAGDKEVSDYEFDKIIDCGIKREMIYISCMNVLTDNMTLNKVFLDYDFDFDTEEVYSKVTEETILRNADFFPKYIKNMKYKL